MVVIVIVPVAIGVPAIAIFIPPAMTVFPARFAGFVQFVPPMRGLLAFISVVLDRFMQFVVGFSQTLLAAVGLRCRHAGKKRQSRGQSRCSQQRFPIARFKSKSHVVSPLKTSRRVSSLLQPRFLWVAWPYRVNPMHNR